MTRALLLLLLLLPLGCASQPDYAYVRELEQTRLDTRACQVCGEEIGTGAALKDGEGRLWHKGCHSGRPRCGITGRPIPNEVEVVEVLGETFNVADYAAAETCLASKLPLVNHGSHIINQRSGTKVLARYKDQTKRCVSCRDHLVEGVLVEGARFSCSHCAESYSSDVEEEGTDLLGEVSAFFDGQGLPTPEVKVRWVGYQDGLSSTNRGRCHTTTTTRGPEVSFEHEIRILSHLSREVTLAILAHEYMHAALAEAGAKLSKGEEEGLCELTAFRFVQDIGLPAYVSRGIEKNTVTLYREGFERQRATGKSLEELLKSARR